MGRVSIEHGTQTETDDGVVIDDAAANKFIGGWKVSAIWTEQSGFPLILNTSVVGGGNRVNLVPGVDPVIHGSRSNVDRVKEWFNIDAFALPPAYTYGTVRRTFTQVRGPGVQNVDASLLKETSFFDRINTEFRAEFFKVANAPHFGMPRGRLFYSVLQSSMRCKRRRVTFTAT